MSSRRKILVLAFALVAAALGAAPALGAAGTVVADLTAPGGAGSSVAFDGQNLYYTALNGLTLHRIAPNGSGHAETPIVGAAGVNALSYDSLHDVFWAVDTTGLSVYRLDRNGLATLQFVINPATDLPGSCKLPLGCSTVVSGVAYDGSDDTLWYLPQGSRRVYHFDTVGHPLGYIDTDGATDGFFPECTAPEASGVAAGRSPLYLASAPCGRSFQYAKTGLKQGSFAGSAQQPGDVECDDTTFNVDVMWARDAADGRLRAVEIPQNTCKTGGGLALPAFDRDWFTGGGTLKTENFNGNPVDVHNGFVLTCSTTPEDPNNLSVTWQEDPDGPGPLSAETHRFHLKAVVAGSLCSIDPVEGGGRPQNQPNKINGSGTGRYSGSSCLATPPCEATVEWELIDRGEPSAQGAADNTQYTIFLGPTKTVASTVLAITCACSGNVQAH